MTPGPEHFLVVSAILFTLGALGVLIRRDPLIMFMSIELMLNSVNLSFVTFSHYVGLALIVSIFQTRQQIDVDELDEMRG